MQTLNDRQEAILQRCLSKSDIRERIESAGFFNYSTIHLDKPIECFSRGRRRLFLSATSLETGRGRTYATRELIREAMIAGTTPCIHAIDTDMLDKLIA